MAPSPTGASPGFAERGWMDEAPPQAWEADDIPAAASRPAPHRHDLINREQWHRLERWLDLLPDSALTRIRNC